MKMNTKIVLILVCFLFIYFGGSTLSKFCGFTLFINGTESLPQKFFVKKENLKNPSKGDYILFSHPWVKTKLVKEVVGVAGDFIQVEENRVFVNGRDCGQCLTFSPRSGKRFSSIESGIIPEGFFFVYAPHRESFDSRYREFGLISLENVEEVVCPVF